MNDSLLTSRATNAVLAFLQLIDKMDSDCAKLALYEKAQHIIIQSGLIQHHEKEGGEKARSRIENLEELVNACSNFNETDMEVPDSDSEGVDLASNMAYLFFVSLK